MYFGYDLGDILVEIATKQVWVISSWEANHQWSGEYMFELKGIKEVINPNPGLGIDGNDVVYDIFKMIPTKRVAATDLNSLYRRVKTKLAKELYK